MKKIKFAHSVKPSITLKPLTGKPVKESNETTSKFSINEGLGAVTIVSG